MEVSRSRECIRCVIDFILNIIHEFNFPFNKLTNINIKSEGQSMYKLINTIINIIILCRQYLVWE